MRSFWSVSVLVVGLCSPIVASGQQIVYDGGNYGSISDAFDMSATEAAANFGVGQNSQLTAGRIFTSYQGAYECEVSACDPNFGFRGQFDWTLYSNDPSHVPGALITSGSVVPIKTVLIDDGPESQRQQWDFVLPNVHVTANTSYWLSLLNTDSTGSYVATSMYWGGAGVGGPYAPSAFRSHGGVWVPLMEDGSVSPQYQNRLSLQLFGVPDDLTTTPEPSSLALLGTGLVGLVPLVRRRRNA